MVAALSAGYGWAVLLPPAVLKRGGAAGSLLALSALTVPYLYGLSRLLGVGAVFTVGTAMTVVSLLFLWAGYAVFKRRGWNAVSLGLACLLLAGLTASVNGTLYLLGTTPPPDAWTGISILLLLLAAAVCFTWKRREDGAPGGG